MGIDVFSVREDPRVEHDACHARRLVAQKKLAGGLLLSQLGLGLRSQDLAQCRSAAFKYEVRVSNSAPKRQSF